jgi:hypothetical protein
MNQLSESWLAAERAMKYINSCVARHDWAGAEESCQLAMLHLYNFKAALAEQKLAQPT